MRKYNRMALLCAVLMMSSGCGAGKETGSFAKTTEQAVNTVETQTKAVEVQPETENSAKETVQSEAETSVEETVQPEMENSAEETAEQESEKAELPNGIYLAEFDSDSSMFRVSEACDGKGTLTVSDGKMMIHISLLSKKILNLYPGLAKDAQAEGAVLLEPTMDTVTYSDGLSETVYGFDVPVPYLNEEFDVALIGTKGKWYDHKVSVSNPVLMEANVPADGTYSAEAVLTGGSGKASVESPAELRVADGKISAVIVWSSPNYDYMLVDGEKYLNEANTGENSRFVIPVSGLDTDIPVTADTTAMSTPHEIDYVLHFTLVE